MRASRTPVEWRGCRVRHLYARTTSDGVTRFEAYRKIDGRPLRCVFDAVLVSEAVRVLPDVLAEMAVDARAADRARTTFREWADDHVAALREKAARGELNGIGHVANTEARLKHLRPLWDVPVAEMTVDHVNRVLVSRALGAL